MPLGFLDAWGHGREDVRPFYNFYSDVSWEEVAQDRDSWEMRLEEMVDWRCANRYVGCDHFPAYL